MLDFLGTPADELRFTLIVRRGLDTYVLPQSPKGWEGALITYARSTTYYGLTRSYSVPMDFVLDGAWVLRKEFYGDKGIESPVQLLVEQLENSTGTYKQIFLGDIDFSQFTDTESIVTVNMMDAGIEAKIKAYGDTQFEIPVSGDGLVNIRLTPIKLTEQADLIVQTPSGNNIDTDRNSFPQINVVNNQQNSTIASVKDVDFAHIVLPTWVSSPNYFYQATTDTDVELVFDIQVFIVSTSGPYNYDLSLYDQNGVKKAIIFSGTHPNGYQESINTTITISSFANDKLFLYQTGSNASGTMGISPGGTISMTYKTVSPEKVIKGLRPKYVYDQLISLMNDGPYPTQSYLLDTTWKGLILTCGDALRSFDGATIKLSWNNFWQSIDAECNAEFGDERGTAVLEKKANAFKRTLPVMDVGDVVDFALTPYTEFIFNTISVGYEDQSYDQTEGRKEINSTQYYKTPITRVQKDLNLVSKIRADALGIYFASINLSGKETKDADSDNDTFFLYVRDEIGIDGNYLPELASVFDSVTGALDGVYNLRLTPKEMLYRHGDYLSGMLDKLSGDRVFFTSALKNTDVQVVNNGKLIDESANVNISSFDAPLFLPYIVTFKCKLSIDALAKLDTLLNGYITFTWDDNEYRGYVIEANVDIAKNSQQEFKVLLTPDNNLLNLVK